VKEQTQVSQSWRGVPVAILGFGVNNRALARWLAKQGAQVTICDQNEAVREADPETANEYSWQVGDAWLSDLGRFTYLFRTPGLRPDQPEILAAVAAGSILTSQTELFFALCPAPIIGITGTKGKGTTSTLLAAMLRAGRESAGFKDVWLAGNIGQDPFDFLDEITTDDVVILELSSFQLMGARVHPKIAILLRITADHQDYHQSMAEYVAAKSHLLREQTKDDIAILYGHGAHHPRFAQLTKATVYEYSRRRRVDRGVYLAGRGDDRALFMTGEGEPLLYAREMPLLGEHNLENVGAAACAAHLLGVGRLSMRQALRAFTPLPHRLQIAFVDFSGVQFVDDAIATTPESTIASIRAFPRRRLHLIIGGVAKTDSYGELPKVIARRCQSVTLLGANSPTLTKLITSPEPWRAKTMEEAVRHICRQVKPHDVVLLAPGAASFDLYPGYAAKGDDFAHRVRQYYLDHHV
jgi:UDP-N-acetylmuramoylalanine--D-glutamate ligase